MEICINNNKNNFDVCSVSNKWGSFRVQYNGKQFTLLDSKCTKFTLSPIDVSKELRTITPEQLKKVISTGKACFSIDPRGEGYALSLKGRLRGGGPILSTTLEGLTICSGLACIGMGILLMRNAQDSSERSLAAGIVGVGIYFVLVSDLAGNIGMQIV